MAIFGTLIAFFLSKPGLPGLLLHRSSRRPNFEQEIAESSKKGDCNWLDLGPNGHIWTLIAFFLSKPGSRVAPKLEVAETEFCTGDRRELREG